MLAGRAGLLRCLKLSMRRRVHGALSWLGARTGRLAVIGAQAPAAAPQLPGSPRASSRRSLWEPDHGGRHLGADLHNAVC